MQLGLKSVENKDVLARLNFLASKVKRKWSVRSVPWERGLLVLRVVSPHVLLYAASELHSKLAHDHTHNIYVRPFLIVSLPVAQGQYGKCSLKSSQNELCWSALVQECLLLSCLLALFLPWRACLGESSLQWNVSEVGPRVWNSTVIGEFQHSLWWIIWIFN